MIGLLALPALAEPPELTAETLFQLRSDLVGGRFAGGIEALSGTAAFGRTRLEGYGDLGYPSGFDAAFGGELYTLAADGVAGPVRWTLGRQPLLLPTWSRRLDGGTLTWTDRGVSLTAAAGLASQSGLTGTLDGRPVGRLAAGVSRGEVRAVAGVWGEAGGSPAAHGDLEARWADAGKRAPEAGLLGAVGVRDGDAVLERGRAEVGLLPTSGVRALGWVEHREALSEPGPLAPAILSTFAPTGSDAVGLAGGVSTRNRARLWMSGSVQRWSPSVAPTGAEDVTGLIGEVRWEPSCGPQRWCLRPSWQGATSEAGAYHRTGAALSLPLPEVAEIDLSAAWVPYREPHVAWRSAVVGGLFGRVVASRNVALEAGADVLADGLPLTTRAWLAVQLRAGGAR